MIMRNRRLRHAGASTCALTSPVTPQATSKKFARHAVARCGLHALAAGVLACRNGARSGRHAPGLPLVLISRAGRCRPHWTWEAFKDIIMAM